MNVVVIIVELLSLLNKASSTTILYYITLHLKFILLLTYNLLKGNNGTVKLGGLDCGN